MTLVIVAISVVWGSYTHRRHRYLLFNRWCLVTLLMFNSTSSAQYMDVGHVAGPTLCRRTCGIRRFLSTVTGSVGRRFYLRSVFSALEFFTRMR